MICKICNLEINERAHFWKNHKIKESDYYAQYEPKYDLLTRELIPFKSSESYLLTDFNNKNNLKKYLETVNKNESLDYLKNWLLKRKQLKNLIYAPGQFECRSLCFPSIKSICQLYGIHSYQQICKEIDLKLKYNYNLEPILNQSPNEILIDTREKAPYKKLELPIRVETLNFADYCPNPNPQNIYIERKEISDFCGVMSKSYDRFEREIQRAKNSNAYIIILIEAKYSDLLSIGYLPQTKWVKTSSDFILRRARDLYLKFNNFQMVAGGNRTECINLFNKLIKIENIQRFDIQWLIDAKKI